ncbi:MAG: SBBP repeat-containing protein [Nostoc sp.]|uniref:SBBP repeat-containing protein n=1 Tax=Nostoc sp. TaxID=1180 RepID=UPI002FF768AA
MSNINNVLWAQQLGGTFPDTGLSIAADTLGNTYVTGAFNGTATFGNTTLTSTSFGYSDAFLAKFDSNKNVLWAQKLGGTLTDYGLGITVDEAGNSYATGFFSGTATFLLAAPPSPALVMRMPSLLNLIAVVTSCGRKNWVARCLTLATASLPMERATLTLLAY